MKSILIALIALVLSGCQTYTIYHESAPSNKDMVKRVGWKRFVFPDMEITAIPNNRVKVFDLAAVTYLPVYISTRNEKIDEGSFKITVYFFPKEEGFTLVPGEVLLNVEDKRDIRPVRYYARQYIGYNNAEHMKDKSYSYFWIHGLTCAQAACGQEVYSSDCFNEVDLEQLHSWNCVDLVFDIDVPDPSQKMSLKIQGLKKNGKLYDVPEINFALYSDHVSDCAP